MASQPAERRIRVVAAVVRRDHGYLVCQRPRHKQHGGLWEFPGGKCEPGESDRGATVRELHEELGVEVVHVGDPLLIIADPGSRYDIVFVPAHIRGEPQALEHEAIGWFAVAALRTMMLAPSDAAFVASLDD